MHPWGGGMSWILPLGLFGAGIGILFGLLILVVLALKGYSLWHAAKRNEKGWFIALLIINTFGILELFYLYYIVKLWNRPQHHEHHHDHHSEHHHS
jgi:Na+(H+)/acetate symporter ActP